MYRLLKVSNALCDVDKRVENLPRWNWPSLTRNAILRNTAIVASPRTTKVMARAAGCLVSGAMSPVGYRQLESDEEASWHTLDMRGLLPTSCTMNCLQQRIRYLGPCSQSSSLRYDFRLALNDWARIGSLMPGNFQMHSPHRTAKVHHWRSALGPCEQLLRCRLLMD